MFKKPIVKIILQLYKTMRVYLNQHGLNYIQLVTKQITFIATQVKVITINTTQSLNNIMFSKLQFLDAVKNPLSKIKTSFKQMIVRQKVHTIQIIPNKLYHISPPGPQNIQSLLDLINSGHQFQLWNIGEYSYSEEILSKILDGRQRNSDGRQIVYNLTYEYFANIPFCEMIKSIESIEAFLALSPENRVFIHCQDNKRRSAVFLACYIFLTGIQTDIVKSILTINKKLNISIQDKNVSQASSGSIYKSQHLVLKNLMNYINNSSFINKNGWNLKKILINNAPKIHFVVKMDTLNSQKANNIKYKVLLEIRSTEGIIYKKIYQDEFIEGQSLCLRIAPNEQIVLKDDFLIIIKYVYQKKGYSIIRAQLNTNFIYDPYFRVQRNDMDLSQNSTSVQNQTFFMDLILQPNLSQFSELSRLNVLKQNSQSQTLGGVQNKENDKKLQLLQHENKDAHENDEEQDGFKILNEEEEAEHNQKMQRQIQQELARQLENIRKKKAQEAINIQQNNDLPQQQPNNNQTSQNVDKCQELNKKDSFLKGNPRYQEVQYQKDPKQTEDVSKTLDQKNLSGVTEDIQQKIKAGGEAAQENEEQSDKGSEQESSSEESSSDQQGHEEDEDLDQYLTKLESQAEKHN